MRTFQIYWKWKIHSAKNLANFKQEKEKYTLILVKLQKIKDKNKILKVTIGKTCITFQGMAVELSADLGATMEWYL